MKKIEKLISPFIESQFPSFYREEGNQFISFVKAYYEWMEQTNNPLWYSRKLPELRDIDTTLDDFIVYFKEKYLKNIQFDTASNKQLLVKNSLELYRSKGTERSIDLFFKLVYGTSAEVKYPGENILRVSDGVWERPEYLEITYSKYNVDYVGKQVIGSRSGATAFVEKYLRRRAGYGYVNMLYISGRQGEFQKGEVIGLSVNGNPVYDTAKRAVLMGSVDEVILQDKGRNFQIGDIVNFQDSTRGSGGIARVTAVSNATGIIDFLFLEGGYGYTLNAESIVSEKVLTIENLLPLANSGQYFRLFEAVSQPIVNATFTSASGTLAIGDFVYSYHANGTVSSSGVVVNVAQIDASGDVMLAPLQTGPFANNRTYYTAGNTISLNFNDIEDRSITATAMGLPNTYILTLSNPSGSFLKGQHLYQANSTKKYARGLINLIEDGKVTVTQATGAFKMDDGLYNEDNPSFSANISNVETTLGVYNINKSVHRLNYTLANNNGIATSPYIYQYNDANKLTAKGLVLTSSFDTGSGNLTIIPLGGYFEDTQQIYTAGNTAGATLTAYSVTTDGGDFVNSDKTNVFGLVSNTNANLISVSLGSGAGFNVGTIGETEVIFIGTDIISANNKTTLNYSRIGTTVGSNTGLGIGKYVYQDVNKIAFNPSTSLNSTTGFITLPTASSRFLAGDIIKYDVAAGNTVINNMAANDYYYVAFSNSTGMILSYPYDKYVRLNTTNYPNFANNVVNESGHYFYKVAYGTVYSSASTSVGIKSIFNNFGVTSSGTYSNSNLISFTTPTNNTAISAIGATTTISTANQIFYTLSPRAAAFGFPKNPQGDVKDTIYSCLSFDRFEIGVISSLSGVDPGADYNIDPYALAYEKNIAAFNRKDFLIKIEDATSQFVVGEKINQVLGSLQYYDLKVSSGVFGNTYNEVSVALNSKDEVVSSANAIYIPSNTVSFNTSTDIENEANTVTIQGNPFVVNDLVRYYTASGNTALSGLSNNTFYYVKTVAGNSITLSTTAGGATIDINGTNTVFFHSNTDIDSSGDFISIPNADTKFGNGNRVKYYTGQSNVVVTGLSNNNIYYVVAANSTGLALSVTSGGANINITGLNPGSNGHYLKYYDENFNGHFLRNYSNPYGDNTRLLYTTATGNTAISGLTNATAYYVVSSNSVAVKLSTSLGGSPVDLTAAGSEETGHYLATIPGYLPKDKVYQNVVKTFDASSGIDDVNDAILIPNNPYANGDAILYYTGTGGTALTNLANNTTYYAVQANSTALKLSTSIGGGVIALSPGVSETHTLKSVANASVYAVYTSGPDSFVRVNNVENTIANTYELFSYTNQYVNGAVSNIELISITSVAKGIVQEGSNTEFLNVKRITFENTFQEGVNVIGDISGATANVVSVSQNLDRVYPIGLNADIGADVITANGQIAALKIVDSGIGYGNGEVVQVTSEDNLRSATVKLIIDGHGVGKGYYRSSKGFLSSDMYIHDGDYYQEYSYEIFSKLSVDRYSDMFKKVMHTAGTKFFGSASVTEEDSLPVTVPEIATGLEIEFDAQDDVSSATERIQVDIEAKKRYINPVNVDAGNEFISIVNNPFSNDDYVRYNLSAGNTQISGLIQNGYYYVVQANSSGLKLSTTANGTPQNLTGGSSEWGHELVSYVNPLSNGDVVVYRTSAGKTPVTNLTNNQIYYVMNTNPISVQLSTTSTGSPINITAAVSSEIGHYLIKIVEEN